MFLRAPKQNPQWQICLNPANPSILIPPSLKADLLIVDPDAAADVRDQIFKNKAKVIAYLSVGEAEDYRGYWSKIREADWLLTENPDWPGNFPVDVRNPEWQAVLLETAGTILSQGFDGLFLDTLNTAEYLEELDPVKYRGASNAAVGLVRELRKRFPDAMILVNHAPTLLDRIGGWIDGAVVEDVHSRWEGEGYRMSTPEEREALERPFKAFAVNTGKPIMTIDYCDEADASCARKSLDASRKAGWIGFVATKALDRILAAND
ncbi:MAG: endo alpha-1,4 polygalactosaminidase [Candidatus Omnitrophica bacterium]|nr:endo alpha-1,4 polygalactosaminidase [Candidatus Omnitrophota bacterium]